MKDSEANTLRCTAHEIIIRLMNEGEADHLRLLQQHADSAMERLEPRKPSGLDLITAERDRQINSEGWTSEHDDQHDCGELRRAAAAYALHAYAGPDEAIPACWPWSQRWWKPAKDPVRNLVKAGALIAADIDRLQRLKG